MPRILKRIVFGYTVDFFPGNLILGYNQLKRMLARAQFDVKVNLAPLNDLPPDTNIVFVPPELADTARQAAPECQVGALASFLNDPQYETLIRQLEQATEWTAAKIADQTSAEDGGEIVNYRGYERIE